MRSQSLKLRKGVGVGWGRKERGEFSPPRYYCAPEEEEEGREWRGEAEKSPASSCRLKLFIIITVDRREDSAWREGERALVELRWENSAHGAWQGSYSSK